MTALLLTDDSGERNSRRRKLSKGEFSVLATTRLLCTKTIADGSYKFCVSAIVATTADDGTYRTDKLLLRHIAKGRKLKHLGFGFYVLELRQSQTTQVAGHADSCFRHISESRGFFVFSYYNRLQLRNGSRRHKLPTEPVNISRSGLSMSLAAMRVVCLQGQ